MAAIETCRTAVLGGHGDVCQSCGHLEISYNSCRNRHCPKCQSLAQARWIALRTQRILPTHYFHLVFTLPAELRLLALRNRRPVFDLLFQAASETVLTLATDPKWLGGRLGMTAVLHTWTRELHFHPHLHCIVTGGGLNDDGQWVAAKRDFLFPVRVLSALFRGKLLDGLRRLRRNHKLDIGGSAAPLRDGASFDELIDALYRTDWVVYAKRPFGGPEAVFAYLGRYTHRIAISNARLVAFERDQVTFATKNGASTTVDALEFIRRFLLHVLPKGFVKIRHYGLLSPAHATTTLEQARAALESEESRPDCENPPPKPESKGANDDDDELLAELDWTELLRLLTGQDLTLCPCCGGLMIRVGLEALDVPGAQPEKLDTS